MNALIIESGFCPNIKRIPVITVNTGRDNINRTGNLIIGFDSKTHQAIFSILVARTVGPNDYGIFVFALSFGTIYSLFIRFDFLSYLNREIPLDKEKGTIKFHAVLGTQIWLVVISTLVMLPICIFLPKPGQEKVIILVNPQFLYEI